MRISDWSSDVCSSDLLAVEAADEQIGAARETVRAAGRPVVDHIGCRAAITVPPHPHVRAQPRPEPGDLEPGGALAPARHLRHPFPEEQAPPGAQRPE